MSKRIEGLAEPPETSDDRILRRALNIPMNFGGGMSTVAEELPNEQQRVRELLEVYIRIPTGAFGAAMLREALGRAERAAASGDVAAMVRSIAELRGCQ